MQTLQLTETISIQKIVEDINFALNKYGKHLKRHNGRKKLIKRLNRFESFHVLIAYFDYYKPLLDIELKKNEASISSRVMMNWHYVIIYAETQHKNHDQIQNQEEEDKMGEIEDETEKLIEDVDSESFLSENFEKLTSFSEEFKSNLTYFNNILKILGELSAWVKGLIIYRKSLSVIQQLSHALEHKLLTLYRLLKIDKLSVWFKQCREKHKWLDRIVRLSFSILLILIGLWVASLGLHLLKTPYKFVMKAIKGHLHYIDEDIFL